MARKRGELSSSEVVMIILAIAAFLVVLVFFGIFKDSVNADEETCRLSVLARATTPYILQGNVPLKCTTQKICISESGKKDACAQFNGEENVVSIKLRGEESDKIKLIEKTTSEAYYSCWTMMGQGKLDLFGTFFGSLGKKQHNTCVVCSRVAFADDIDDDLLKQTNVEQYMDANAIPGGSISYSAALTNNLGLKSLSEYRNVKPQDDSGKSFTESRDRQTAIVFSQIKQVNTARALENVAYTGAAATFAVPGAYKLILNPYGIAAVGLATGAAGLNAYLNANDAITFCGKITSGLNQEDLDLLGENGNSGCSVLQAIHYNVQNVNTICETIQGSP